MAIYTEPFTYLIGWSSNRTFYYGVRYAKGCSPKDLWSKYFTSSKHVWKFREEHGEPDVVQIRRLFETIEEAKDWEHKVLRRMKVRGREDFLNKTDNKVMSNLGYKFDPVVVQDRNLKISKTLTGHKDTDEVRLKKSAGQKIKYNGNGFTKEHRENISKSRTGIIFSKSHCAAISSANTGKVCSETSKLKKSKANKQFFNEHPETIEEMRHRTSTWHAAQSSEEKLEHGRKIAEGKRRAKEARLKTLLQCS